MSSPTVKRDSSADEDANADITIHNRYATQETPLLGGEAPKEQRDLYRQNMIIVLIAYLLVANLGHGAIEPPLVALMENVICRNYYPEVSHSIWADDPRCKDHDVQGTLATIRGWSFTFDCIPGIIGAVPYGIMSDKWGRKPVLVLSMVGYNLSCLWKIIVLYFPNIFPIWTIWLGSAFQLIGGSASVMSAMLYTIAADISPVAERATVFMQLQSWILVAQMLSGPLASILMRRSPWLGMLVAFALLVVGNIICLVFPETLDIQRSRDRQGQVAAQGPASLPEDSVSDIEVSKKTTVQKLWAIFRKDMTEIYHFILLNQRTTYLTVSTVFVGLGSFVLDLLLQYVTKRFGWTYDRAAILITIRSASTLLLLAVVLPFISWLCVHKFKMSGVSKDLWLSRVSGVVQILGALMVAFSVTAPMLMVSLVVLSAGRGMTALVRSLANTLVEEHHVGILNSLLGFLDMVGILIAGPILAGALKVGFEWGGPWVGLPFMVSAALFTVATVVVWTFSIPKGRWSAESV